MGDSYLFLCGGARSGKSAFAVEVAERSGRPVTFVATADPGDDDDLWRRIERHRRDRPAHWNLREEPLELVEAIVALDGTVTVIVECLTLWTANLLQAGRDPVTEAAALARGLQRRPGQGIVVSNEVGLGVHPPTALGREYRDVHGRVNQVVAAGTNTALFFVAGKAIALHDPWSLLDQ